MIQKPTDTGRWLAHIGEHVASLNLVEGAALGRHDRALIGMGLVASVTSLNSQAIDVSIKECFEAGATPQQIQEVVSIVSGLGAHSLMATAAVIVARAREAGYEIGGRLSDAESEVWKSRVGNDPFWAKMEDELPDFLRSLLSLSGAQFQAFFDYCGVPWKNGVVRPLVKELLAMACDANPSHVFLPGFRLHLGNAIQLGAGRSAVNEALALAAKIPPHIGFGTL
jgi:alkylhydroperoxidase/carboxymuconolactone decarboxylase family protein YurZ